MVWEQIYQEINAKKQLGIPQIFIYFWAIHGRKQYEKNNNARMSLYKYQTKLT